MFDKYSLVDLFANIYKNRKKNLIIGCIVALLVLVPFVLKAGSNEGVEASVAKGTNHSSYITYNIESEMQVTQDGNLIEPYSAFYSELIFANLNGAYLFSDVDDDTLKLVSEELSIDKTQLINSDNNYWSGKIVVKPLPENGTVGIKVLTSSEKFNEIVETKIDKMINETKDYFPNVTIEKLSSIDAESAEHSEAKEPLEVKNTEQKSFDTGMVAKGLIIAIVFAIFFIFVLNFIAYVFSPTMNNRSAFEMYGFDFIYDFDTAKNCAEMLEYRKTEDSNITLVTTSEKVLKKYKDLFEKEDIQNPISIIHIADLHDLLKTSNLIFVEEYGITRFAKFEKAIQQVKNCNKQIIGAINLPL